jgi:hypothetical protein
MIIHLKSVSQQFFEKHVTATNTHQYCSSTSSTSTQRISHKVEVQAFLRLNQQCFLLKNDILRCVLCHFHPKFLQNLYDSHLRLHYSKPFTDAVSWPCAERKVHKWLIVFGESIRIELCRLWEKFFVSLHRVVWNLNWHPKRNLEVAVGFERISIDFRADSVK